MTVQEMENKLANAVSLIDEAQDILDSILSEFDSPGIDLYQMQHDLYALFPDDFGYCEPASTFVEKYGELLEKINSGTRICAKPAICGEPANSCGECPHYRYDDNYGEKACFASADYAKSQTEREAKSE